MVEKKQRVAGREIIGIHLLKPQVEKLKKLLDENPNATPANIRETLRLHMSVVVDQTKIVFYKVFGLNETFNSYSFCLIDTVLAMHEYMNEHFSYIDEQRHFAEKSKKLEKALLEGRISPEEAENLLAAITEQDKARIMQIRLGYNSPVRVDSKNLTVHFM